MTLISDLSLPYDLYGKFRVILCDNETYEKNRNKIESMFLTGSGSKLGKQVKQSLIYLYDSVLLCKLNMKNNAVLTSGKSSYIFDNESEDIYQLSPDFSKSVTVIVTRKLNEIAHGNGESLFAQSRIMENMIENKAIVIDPDPTKMIYSEEFGIISSLRSQV